MTGQRPAMRRALRNRPGIHLPLAVVLVGFLLGVVWGCGHLRGKRDNIVLITLDTLRADHLGYSGYARGRTPHLDAFAQGAIRFTTAFTSINTTLASHAAMLSGRFPHSIGVPRNAFPVPEDVPLLQELLRAKGYETAAFVSSLAVCSRMGLARGFDHYDEVFDLGHGDQLQRRAETTTRAVLAWLENGPREPYFLWVHYFDPHYPYDPPAPHDALYGSGYQGPANGSMEYLQDLWDREASGVSPTEMDLQRLVDLYDGEVAYLDHWLGPLFNWLDQPERRARTLVVIAADHGESLTEHDYLFNHGLHLYQPSMHVPLLVRPPGRMDWQPRSLDVPVQTHSIGPLILAHAGLAAPAGSSGDHLGVLIWGEPPWRCPAAFGEASQPWIVEQQYPGEYQNLHKAQMVVDYPWKLIVTPYRGQVELYDLQRDPAELVDVASEHPERVEEMRRELARWRGEELRIGARIDPEVLRRLRSLGYLK